MTSACLTGGSELANRPAVIDAPLGESHVVLFANNPMRRNETHGSFFLLFKVHDRVEHLDAGKK